MMFQSLKRDVAYFHVVYSSSNHRCQRVSIAQARCGLLPLSISLPMSSHPCMVSIAQARCGLLPLESWMGILHFMLRFQSLKRDVAYFHASGMYVQCV